MTRHQYTKNIYQELKALNKRIDYKILRGERYTQESKRHKELLKEIREQRRQSFGRFVSSLFQFQ